MREIVGRIQVLWDENKKEQGKLGEFQKSVDEACSEVQELLKGAIPQVKVVAEHKKLKSEIFAYLDKSPAEGLAFLTVSMSDSLSQEEVARKILQAIEEKLLEPILDKKSKMLK